jgi:DNA-binding MarR family transcriptional regulator
VPQYLALRAIRDEGVSGGELARRAGVSGAATSQLLASLAEAGLLARRVAASDRRRHELALTPEGERTLASAQARVAERLAELLGHLPPPEADALARSLDRVAAVLSGAPPPRRPPKPPPPPHRRH